MKKIQELLDRKPPLRQYLFARGFLLTNASVDLKAFPFYGLWNKTAIGSAYSAYTHKLQRLAVVQKGDRFFFLFGHAYNPFTMETEEAIILQKIADAYGTAEYQSCIDEITGVFLYGVAKGENLEFLVDPAGMQSVCYGMINGTFSVASHSQLLGDMFDLHTSDIVKELIHYKWYHRVMGDYLPADMTPFTEVKRVVPGALFCFQEKTITHKRFWPREEIRSATGIEYKRVIRDAAKILKRNMHLVSEKWESPAISLTGGIDSNTTFAAANGDYEHFHAFSYVSAEKEKRDAEAAQVIADHFNVPFQRYDIPDDNRQLENYRELVEILKHNNGYVITQNENEYRKRAFLIQNLTCDVEVKSWVSETIRAYWYKHFGRSSFPPLSPKLFRNLYKIFLTDRRLARKVDDIFRKYIVEFEYNEIPSGYPAADIFFNEVTWGSWGSANIAEMQLYSEITFIYNNRKFLDLMFRVPLKKRINDQHHLDMKRLLNSDLAGLGIRVVNMKETKARAFLLNCIFTLNMLLPF